MNLVNNMKFEAKYTLNISEENLPLLPVIAREFGWSEWMHLTPQQVIELHYQNFFDQSRIKVESWLLRLKWEINREEVNQIMEQYDSSVLGTSQFYED